MGWPCGLGGHMSWAVVSAQPAVHGVAPPTPGISGAPSARTGLPCSLMPQLPAPASSPPPPSAPEKLVSGPEEGPHTTAWFGVVMGCGPGRGSQPGPGWLAMGPRVLGPGRGSGEGGQESQVSRVRGS